MRGDGILQIINSFYIKIAVFGFLQLTNLTFENWYYKLSSWMAIVSVIFVVCYPFGIAIMIWLHRNKLNDKKFREKYEGIFDEYKEDKFSTATFETFVCLRKLFLAMSLVY